MAVVNTLILDCLLDRCPCSFFCGSLPSWKRRSFKETNSPLIEHLPPLPGKGQVSSIPALPLELLVYWCERVGVYMAVVLNTLRAVTRLFVVLFCAKEEPAAADCI